jgi:hypothetical protein
LPVTSDKSAPVAKLDPSSLEPARSAQTASVRSGFRFSATAISAAAIALILFIATNLILARITSIDCHPQRGVPDNDKDVWSNTMSIDFTADQFTALKQRPEVVLLGSSLMMQPFWHLDHVLDPSISDIFHYHGCIAIERELAAAGLPNQHVFNMGTFGQMVSDAYIWTNEFLRGDKAPDVVVLGLAPRDFHDAELSATMNTLTFQRLIGLQNLGKYSDLYMPNWQDRLDFIASHTMFLYERRWRVQREMRKAMDRMCSWIDTNKPATPAEETTMQRAVLFGKPDYRWYHSKKEYHIRYRNIDVNALAGQMLFLKQFLLVCHERQIRVILVNMPLSAQNIALMPPGFYAGYCAQIENAARTSNVKLINLARSAEFKNSDFWDTAHLNEDGGKKLVKAIAPVVAQELRVSLDGSHTGVQ